MATGKRVKSGVYVEGLKPVLKRLTALGKDLNREVRVSAKQIAEDEATAIKAAAGGDKLSAAVATTIRARSDRLPSIVGGGARKLQLSGRPPGGAVFFGAEFGGRKRKTTMQFRPHRGRQGYWLWPTLEKDREKMLIRWSEAVERAIAGMQ